MTECRTLPPGFEWQLKDGAPCDLPEGHGTTHQSRLPDGRIAIWDAFECAYPDDCQYDGDGDCCVSFSILDSDRATHGQANPEQYERRSP